MTAPRKRTDPTVTPVPTPSVGSAKESYELRSFRLSPEGQVIATIHVVGRHKAGIAEVNLGSIRDTQEIVENVLKQYMETVGVATYLNSPDLRVTAE